MSDETNTATEEAPATPATPRKHAVKKTAVPGGQAKIVKKAPVKKKAAAAKAPAKRDRVTTEEVEAQIVKVMRKGKNYTSREVVEALGRTPGSQEGGPVVRTLKRMVDEKKVKHGPNEGVAGNVWCRL